MTELTDKLTKLKEAAYRTWSMEFMKPTRRSFKEHELCGLGEWKTCLCLISAAAYDKMNPADRQAFLNMESGQGEFAMDVVRNEFELTYWQAGDLIIGFDTDWNDDYCLGPSMAFAKEVADTLKKEGKL